MRTFVIDFGEYQTKLGFAGPNQPTVILDTKSGSTTSDITTGAPDYAYFPREDHTSEIELLISQTLSKLDVDPTNVFFLFTEYPMSAMRNREAIAELMFESFSVPGLYISDANILSLYANSISTGLSIDFGQYSTRIVPVYEGFAVSHVIGRLDIGGWHLTNALKKLLTSAGHSLSWNTVEQIKHQVCRVQIGANKVPQNFEFEDLELKLDICEIPEILFDTKDETSLPEMICNATPHEAAVANELFRNIVLSGGGSQFPGLSERIAEEVRELCPVGTAVKVTAGMDSYDAWRGASKFVCDTSFENLVVKASEYREKGVTAVYRCV